MSPGSQRESRRLAARRTTALAAACGLLSTLPGAARESAEHPAPLRQSFDLRVPAAPTPVVIAGTPQLVYELHVTSFANEPLTVRRVEVLDAGSAAVVAALDGADLERRWGRLSSPSADLLPGTLAPGTLGVLYLEIPLPPESSLRAVEHRIAYDIADKRTPPPGMVQGARTPVRLEPPVVLAPPLRGGPWAAVYHPAWERGHRRVVYAVDGRARIPGRFAVDWILLDAAGRQAHDDEDAISNWHGYGADVLAVSDGVVVSARDDVAESTTLSGHARHPLEDATGNYVSMDLGSGRYAFYEHLKPRSIRVRPGDHVVRGQVIASLGFTGQSTGPHLHFHVADANSPLAAEGLAFVLDRFTVLGAYDEVGELGDAPWTAPLGERGGLRTNEFPAPNVVVDFATDAAAPDASGNP